METKKRSIKKKLMTTIILIVVITIVFTATFKTVSDLSFRETTDEILIDQALGSAEVFAEGQTESVNEQITALIEKIKQVASFTEYVYRHPDRFAAIHNKRPSEFPADTVGVTFHWSAFSEEDIDSPELIAEADMLSALEGQFESLKAISPMIQSVYVATTSHINIGYDESVLAKVGRYYSPIEANAQWFLKPIEDGKVYVSDAYHDEFGRGLLVTVSAPYVVDGKVHGVIGADMNLEKIEETILNIDMEGISGEAVLLAADGTPICVKDMNEKTTAETVLGKQYKEAVAEMKANKKGSVESNIGGTDRYIMYNTIESTGWKLGIILSVDDVLAPTKTLDANILRITVISLVISVILLGVLLIIVSRFANKFTRPILKLTADVEKIGDGNLEYTSDIHTGDEVEVLSNSFEQMTDSLKQYIHHLTSVTAENERIGTELNVATHIQASMLPCIFPAFPDRDEFDIYATMNPAKEVGGDFYDFFMVDNTHIAIVMADVSGKGVPAALFMVIAKTLIKDHTTPDRNLGEIFTKVNEILCESNSDGMFVTAFEGVLDLVTGEFTFVNAGHEMPFICKQGELYKPYKIKAAFVLAGMEGMRYKAGSMTLDPGDKVFQYTDGVTEATNADNKLYGMDRLEIVLGKNADKTPAELLPAVKADIDAFVGEAPQFDDITMLCLEYKKKMTPPEEKPEEN